MPDRPFGFGPPGGGRPGSGSGSGGSGSGSSGGPPDETGGAGPLGPLGDPQQFADALRQFADLMSWQGGPVNWDLAKNVARQAVVAEGDPSVLDSQRRQVDEALRLADLWLGDVTPVLVDRDNLAHPLRSRQVGRQCVPEPARGPGDGDGRRSPPLANLGLCGAQGVPLPG